MDFLCTRAWLEMTDISSILVSMSFKNKGFPTLLIFTSDYHWFITRGVSDTAVKEMRSERRGQLLVPKLGWKYYNYPDCKTVR